MSAAATSPSVGGRKAALRARLLAARRVRSGPDADHTPAIVELSERLGAQTVVGYVALPGEPDVGPALNALRARGVRVLLPVVGADRDLTFRDWDGPLVAGHFGTSVPEESAAVVDIAAADLLLVPAVAVDRRGRRLGRGGGSYDRTLPRARGLVVAVVHPEELLDEVPVEPHDVRVGAVLAGLLHEVTDQDQR